MNFKKSIYLFYFIVVASAVNASTKDSTYIATRQKFITDKTDKLSISIFNRNPNNQIEILGRNNIVYNPNDANTQGIRLQHKWLGIAIGYTAEKLQQSNKGKTAEIDIQLYGYGKKRFIDLYYVNYTGFYIENYRKNDSLRVAFNTFPLLPNMQNTRAGLNYLHVFNHKKFSLQSSFLHNEIQRKSAGSLILGASVNYMNFYNPHNIINLLDNTQPQEYLNKGHFYGVSFLAGYGHTFVYKKVYLTLAPIIGLVGQQQNITFGNTNTQNKNSQIGFRSIGRVSIGYNSERFFAAITGVNDTYNQKLSSNVVLHNQLSEARVIIGYRFNTKGIIKKVSDMMDKYNPIK
ncbi:MAG: DUF4421 family protein [Bacteroidia bacterium]|nr:DUF4421 family protein [Bacteroidia bacterium]MBP9688520.1 DUF4421 family protein [Bacteroidia bacterium]